MQAAAIYERARQSRDARFDGQFFVGVKTTGIYCRPICPANLPKPENVDFFPTAAAASEAGFRPCLRCRPECAPGTPAWHGTSTTVRRGLRLIANGALDDGNVEQLAERLGVTGRHLRRLFTKHLGASPLAIAHTQRLHFAKRLIDETDLPLAEIAAAAGYGSVRRFNDAFRVSYGRAPRELRRRGRVDQPAVAGAALSVRLGYRRPFDWPRMLDFVAGRAIPGVEAVVDGRYLRSIRAGDRDGVIEVAHDTARDGLVLTVHGVATSELFPVVQRVRELFDLDAPVADIARVLGRDKDLKARLRRYPGIRVPGAWSGFELTVRAVLGQQVSVKAATTLSGRLVERCGAPLDPALAERFADAGIARVFPEPRVLARASLDGLGITGARIETIRRVADAAASGRLAFDSDQEPQSFVDTFTALRGIGDWTASYVAMRALKDPDAFPASDLGLLRAFDAADGTRPTPKQLAARAEAWRPWRAYAALLLWSSTPGSGG